MYLKNYFFFKRVDCIKQIFKLSLKFLVLSLTDVEREREKKGGRERGGERGGEREREGEKGRGRERGRRLSLNFTYKRGKLYRFLLSIKFCWNVINSKIC